MHFSQHMHSIAKIGHLFSNVDVVIVKFCAGFRKHSASSSSTQKDDEVVEPSCSTSRVDNAVEAIDTQ